MSWYQNPYKLLDPLDFAESRSPRRLYDLFLNESDTSRPVDRDAFTRILGNAMGNLDYNAPMFTRAESTSLRLEEEALCVWEMQPRQASAYVAEKRGTTRRQAQKLLRQAKIKVSSQSFAFDDGITLHEKRTITSADVRSRLASTPKECAGLGTPNCTGHATVGKDLCYNCYKTYKHEKPDWLLAKIRIIRHEHYAEARASLEMELPQ